MKKPTFPNDKPVPKAKTEQLVAVAATVKKAIKSSQAPKSPKKAQAVAATQVAETPEITLPERNGLTVGNIWHYLSENGATSPARVVNVASYWAGGLDLNDLEFKSRKYDNDKAYRQSK